MASRVLTTRVCCQSQKKGDNTMDNLFTVIVIALLVIIAIELGRQYLTRTAMYRYRHKFLAHMLHEYKIIRSNITILPDDAGVSVNMMPGVSLIITISKNKLSIGIGTHKDFDPKRIDKTAQKKLIKLVNKYFDNKEQPGIEELAQTIATIYFEMA